MIVFYSMFYKFIGRGGRSRAALEKCIPVELDVVDAKLER